MILPETFYFMNLRITLVFTVTNIPDTEVCFGPVSHMVLIHSAYFALNQVILGPNVNSV